MSSIEERLQRDIAAVTEGVVVTEQDMRDARVEVEDRIEIGKQRDRRRNVGAILAAAVVVPIIGALAFQNIGGDDEAVAPATPPTDEPTGYSSEWLGSEPTLELIKGVWRVDDSSILVWFRADGSVHFDDAGSLFSTPMSAGTYALAGDQIVITTTAAGGDGERCAGTETTVQAGIAGRGSMTVVNVGPTSESCSLLSSDGRWNLHQTLPTTHEYMRTFRPLAEDDFAPLTRTDLLYGDWVAVGGDAILEMTPDGAYVVAAESGDVVDRGSWTVTDRRLQLVSSADSPSCGAGDRFVLGPLTHSDPGDSEFIRGRIVEQTCGGAWARDAWYLLPREY